MVSKSTPRFRLCGCFESLDCRTLFVLCILATVLAGLVINQMTINYKAKTLVDQAKPKTQADQTLLKQEDNMCNSELKYFPDGRVDFRGFNNYTGYKSGCYLVPDIVHLIKFNQDDFTFMEMICIASILINHKPQVLKIHTNVFRFKGRYWAAIQRLPEFRRVRVVYLSQPTSIFGHSLTGGFATFHAGDVARLQLMQKHGGIYLDSDVYVTRSLNPYRRFEFVVEWNYHMNLGNQVLLAHKDARILPFWLETYKQYNGSLWYYNGGELPTKAVLEHKPELFHRVRDKFGTDTNMLGTLYHKKDWKWKEYPAIHLFIRHQDYKFDENSTLKFGDFPIRQMILDVMPDYMYPTLTEQ